MRLSILLLLLAISCGGRSLQVDDQVNAKNTNDKNNENRDNENRDNENRDNENDSDLKPCGYDLKPSGSLLSERSDSSPIALAPQGVYVLESSSPPATLQLFEAGSGKFVESTTLHSECSRLYDLEWQDGVLYVLGSGCDWTMSDDAVLLHLANGHLVKGPSLGKGVIGIASGAEDGQFFVLKSGGIGRVDPKKAGAPKIEIDPNLPKPPGWGPTSGFTHADGHFMFSRDAFEGGMTNKVLFVGSGCTGEVDVERWLPGMTNVQIAADGDRLMLMGTSLEAFVWSVR